MKPRPPAIAAAKARDAALEPTPRILLCRYGVLFRDLLARESNAPKWRDLLPILRRLEARGEIRGGRFVSGAFGEQFALPEAVDGLRAGASRSRAPAERSGHHRRRCRPLNLAGILVPGETGRRVPGREVCFQNGAALEAESAAPPPTPRPRSTRNVADDAARRRCRREPARA